MNKIYEAIGPYESIAWLKSSSDIKKFAYDIFFVVKNGSMVLFYKFWFYEYDDYIKYILTFPQDTY